MQTKHIIRKWLLIYDGTPILGIYAVEGAEADIIAWDYMRNRGLPFNGSCKLHLCGSGPALSR